MFVVVMQFRANTFSDGRPNSVNWVMFAKQQVDSTILSVGSKLHSN